MKNNFKILIVDDEVLIAEFLKDELLSLGYENIALAHNTAQWKFKMEAFKPELILLDIRMKNEKEGIEIANEINNFYKTPFIFITAHSDREMFQEALLTNPRGYITKPFKQIDVYAAIKLVEKTVHEEEDSFIIVKEGYSEIKLPFDEILYAQSDNNYIHIFTTTKKHTIRTTLEWFKENTPENLFHRSHRCYFVNIAKITKSTSKSIFIGDVEIPVSRGNKIRLD